MYICICNAVTERQIRALAEQGISTMAELSRVNGCSTTCGSCLEDAQQILQASQPSRKKIKFDVAMVNGLSQAM